MVDVAKTFRNRRGYVRLLFGGGLHYVRYRTWRFCFTSEVQD